jgi:hypothetical protein
MAVEVEAGAYMNQVGGIFLHNSLHDLESLWWVGVWFLLCHYKSSGFRDSTVQRHIEIVKTFGETLFNNRIYALNRRHALTGAVPGSALLTNIEPLSYPKSVQYLVVALDEFREQLVAYYTKYKPKASQDRSFFISDVHREFRDVFEVAIKGLTDDQTSLWPLDHIQAQIIFFNGKK